MIETDKLKKDPEITSQFKDFYVHEGRLLAVFKEGDPITQAQNEVEMLNKLKENGIATPNPELVDVMHDGKPKKGILMDKVPGVFVDMAKVDNVKVLTSVMQEAALGKKLDTSEMGMIKFNNSQRKGEVPLGPTHEVLKEDLEKILKLATEKGIVVNDLQFMVTSTGKAVVIDPQWVGPMKEMKESEAPLIGKTYKKLDTAIKGLTPPTPKVGTTQKIKN